LKLTRCEFGTDETFDLYLPEELSEVLGGTLKCEWYQDENFDLYLPEEVADAIAQYYGCTSVGIEFAQMLASFLVNQGSGWKLKKRKR